MSRRVGIWRERGAAAFNTLATCILIALLISTGMSYYFQLVRHAREVALRYELANIRTAIVLFTTLNRRFPASIRELVDKECLLPDAEYTIATGRVFLESRTIFKRAFLEPTSLDARGQVIDPFGRPYRYDPLRGAVAPDEQPYRQW
jgi:hypothetical protein